MVKKRKHLAERTVVWIAFFIFLFYAITLAFPFLWMIVNSFKSHQEFMFDSIWTFPKNFTLMNWVNGFKMKAYGVSLPMMFFNSILFSVGCTFISVTCTTLTAYCMTKYKFFGSKAMYSLIIVLMVVPAMGTLASSYKLMNDLKLYDTYAGIFISSINGFGSGFVLLYGFFKNLSWSFAEAAFMDGAGHFTVLFKVMIPLALPGILSVAIFGFIGIWNDYFSFYMYAPSKVTIAVGLNGLMQVAQQSGDFPSLFAVMIISIAPVIIVFCIFQKMIMENTAVGGIKG